MAHTTWQTLGPTHAHRIAMAAAWAYFVATVTLACVIAGAMLFTDWAFTNKYGSGVLMAAVLGCMVLYPLAQIIAFRAPAHQWHAIGLLLVLNLFLISVFLAAAGGMLFHSALMLFASAMLIIDHWRRRNREAAQTTP